MTAETAERALQDAPRDGRRVIALEIPAFPVAVERLRWPPLSRRPVVIAEARSPRTAVLSVSAEAAAAGLAPGQPVGVVRQLCPEAEILPPDFATYRAVQDEVGLALSRFSPLVEPCPTGRFFVDATCVLGRAAGLGRAVDLAGKARRDVLDRTGLDATVGVASNKLVSGIAAEEAERRDPLCGVAPGTEARFLAPLPTPRLPGVGERTEARLLSELNVLLVGQLAAIGVPVLATVFGRFAPVLHERAIGIDPRPVLPPERERDVVETAILPADSNDDRTLRAAVSRLASVAAFRLRRDGQSAARVTLTLSHIDDVDSRASAALEPPAVDEARIERSALGLLERCGARRVRVRALALRLSGLNPASRQLDLFSPAVPVDREARLTMAMDTLRRRFGAGALVYGRML